MKLIIVLKKNYSALQTLNKLIPEILKSNIGKLLYYEIKSFIVHTEGTVIRVLINTNFKTCICIFTKCTEI